MPGLVSIHRVSREGRSLHGRWLLRVSTRSCSGTHTAWEGILENVIASFLAHPAIGRGPRGEGPRHPSWSLRGTQDYGRLWKNSDLKQVPFPLLGSETFLSSGHMYRSRNPSHLYPSRTAASRSAGTWFSHVVYKEFLVDNDTLYLSLNTSICTQGMVNGDGARGHRRAKDERG